VNDKRNAAELYRAQGWHALVLHPLSKRPKRAGWQKEGHADPPEAFGPGDNIGIGLGRVSGGLVDVDLDCAEAVAVAPAFLPPTCTFGRASRWRSHWLYKVTGDLDSIPRTSKWQTAHVELRGSGGQTVFPPSVRGYDKKKDPPGYQPEQLLWCDHHPLASIDAKVLRAAVLRVAAASILRQALPHMAGGVHHGMLALAGILKRAGWPLEHARAFVDAAIGLDEAHRGPAIEDTYALGEDAETTGLPTLARIMGDTPAKELYALVRDDALGYTPPAIEVLRDEPPFNDAGNATRLIQAYGRDLRFAEGVGWLRWAGTHWAVDPAGPWPEAEAVAEELRTSTAEGDVGKAHRKHGLKLGNAGPLQAMIQLASKRAEIRVAADALDSDPWLLGTPGGTLDLRSGLLRPAAREDLITLQTGCAPDWSRPADRFDRFLLEVMGGHVELAGYLLRHAGWSLTGDTSEHVVSSWWGSAGRNGKSTLLEVLLGAWGDYGTTIATEVLLQARGERHPTGLMDLRGRRLAVAHELPTGKALDAAILKRLTGGDRIKARGMHQDFCEFRPSHHLIMTFNDRPPLRDNGPAMWARVHLVPWSVSFLGREDPRLLDDLRAEAPAILARCVQGCAQWIAQGRRLAPPQVMRDATQEYREAMDTLGVFVDEEIEIDAEQWVAKKAVYERYAIWAEASGEDRWSASVFYRQLVERLGGRVRESKHNGLRIFDGCQLRRKDFSAKGLAVVRPAG
jgi:putative DNA primase/helicase